MVKTEMKKMRIGVAEECYCYLRGRGLNGKLVSDACETSDASRKGFESVIA